MERSPSRLSRLWQGPALLVSLGLFGYAGYRFLDPKLPTGNEKVRVASELLAQQRPEAALDYLNKLLSDGRLDAASEGKVHILMAKSIQDVQRDRQISLPVNHERIVTQMNLADALGVKPDAAAHQMLGESYEALGKTAEALAHYRLAMGVDRSRATGLQKKVIELQLDNADPAGAEASIQEYLENSDLSESERAWAMGQRAQILIQRKDYAGARELVKQALKPGLDPVAQGQLNYQMGYCAHTLGDSAEAERYLRLAREQLRVQHPVDADAAYLLGKIYEDRQEPEMAKSFYQVILLSHPDARVAPLAQMGRGLCRLSLGEDEPALNDLHDLAGQVNTKSSKSKYKDEVIAGLKRASAILIDKQKFAGALEAMAYEQELRGEPQGEFFARLGLVYEKRAEQLDHPVADEKQADRIKRDQQVRDYRSKAGDAYVAYSKALRLADDGGYGESLWRGIDLFDRAGDLQRAISALEVFIAERPSDSLTPDAMLRLGRAYQAAGLFDKAIYAFRQNQVRHGQSLAASKSLVPLAQAYIAKGPEMYSKAEEVLLGVVDNNPLLTPDAEEFKQGLFELAQLYYRTQRYEEAVSRLDEWTRRYPKDGRLGQMAFLMADSYRKSAGLLQSKAPAAGAATQPAAVDPAEAQQARAERLNKARHYYDQVVDFYKTDAPATENDRLQLKLAYFYRADCMYDLGEYDQAIKLYDAASLRYQDDPASLAGYVQIVNAYCALGKRDEARVANERVKWLLRRMPPESFAENQFAMSKEQWNQWLKWASASGMWESGR